MIKHNNTKTAVNLIFSMLAFLTNFCIGFFLSPYIVKTLGAEANGFVTLANNFVSYATILTSALNSMASRFISLEYHKGDKTKATEYYTSLFVGNAIITIILLFVATLMIFNLEKVINIPFNLIWDVKLLFAFIFAEFFIATGLPNWDVATYITKMLYLNSMRETVATIGRAIIIYLLFAFFSPHVYYLGITAVALVVYRMYYSFYYKKKLLPDLKINLKMFRIRAALNLISSGIWNSITKLGFMLQNGLDVLMTNIFIGPVDMGIIAISKTIPNMIGSLCSSITTVFVPNLIENYAKNNISGMLKELRYGMKICGMILTVPVTVFLVFGKDFFNLWVPSMDAEKLQLLSLLACGEFIFFSNIRCLYNVFTVTNKIKTNSILIIIVGFINVGIVYVLLNTTNMGIYAVASVSVLLNILMNLLYDVPFIAKYIGLKWYTFYPQVLYSLVSCTTIAIIGVVERYALLTFVNAIDTWSKLIVSCAILCVLGVFANLYILLDKPERTMFYNKIGYLARKIGYNR